jgi:hypothetical protein
MQYLKDKKKQLFAGRLSAFLPVLLFFSFFFLFSTGFGQTSDSDVLHKVMIKGKVEDSLHKTVLSRVTIIVHDVAKNQIDNRTYSTDDGSFEIAVLSQKQYLLEISHVGYHSKSIKLYSFLSASANLGSIALIPLPNSLKEIQILAVKPLIDHDVDKLIYNVEADPESRTAAAMDILRKIPFLTTDAEDNLQLNGSDNFRILINGKSSTLFLRSQGDFLKNLSASSIRSIEVMTVPSSKYEAQGVGGIINIITYKKSISGYSGGVNLQASKPQGLYINSNLTASISKFSFSGNIGYNTSNTPESNSTSSRQDKRKESRLEQWGAANSNYASQNAGGEISYQLNSENIITAGYNRGKGNSGNRFNQQATLFNAAGLPSEVSRYLNIGESKQSNNDFSLDYLHSFKKNEVQQLTFLYKRSSNNDGSMTDFKPQPFATFNSQLRKTNNNEKSGEQIFQADYVQPIKKHILELGVSSILRKSSSYYFYKVLDTVTGAFEPNTSQSNAFHYTENIYAAYTSFNLKMEKWGLRLGARLEQAKIDARFVSSGTFARQKYMNVIPAFTLSRKLNGFSLVRLSYTQRLNRQTLDYLNPFIDFSDPWNISYGNPGLQPALAHVIDLTYNTSILKSFLNFAFFHQFTNSSIQQYTTLGHDTISRTTFGNIGKNKNYTFSFSGNTMLFKNLNIGLNGNASYLQYTHIVNDKPYRNEGFTYNVMASISYRFKGWRTGSNIGYNAPNVLLQGRSADYFHQNISLSKQFLKNQKATVGILVNSPFQEQRHIYTEVNDPAFYLIRQSHSIIRKYTLSLNYRLGKVHGGVQKK